jgi:hypothetical protein
MVSRTESSRADTDTLTLGGAGMAFNRRKLLRWFQAGVALYLAYFYFAVQFRSLELLLLTGVVILAALLPSYLWCAGKVHGLPIVPVFALGTFPTYILPIQRGSKLLEQFSPETESKALLCLIGFLLILTAVWHQMCNNPGVAPQQCRMMKVDGSTGILVAFLVLGMLFQIAGVIFYQFSGGLFSLIRGYTGNAAMLSTFIFAYRLGMGTLSPSLKLLLFGVVGLLIVTEAASFILAGALVRLAVIGAGYTLGSQRIPWKSAISAIALLSVLHAGKAEMRAAYWKGGQGTQTFGLLDYPEIFAEWIGGGIKVLATGKTKEEFEVASAAERGSMIQVFLRILEWTPAKKPFLDGETYRGIPALLVPRILYKEKGIAHMGNWIMAYHYEFLTMEELGKTSVGFDLLSEAYANYGFIGVGFLAVILAVFYGVVSRLSVGVPLLSARFLFAVLVLSGTLSSNNTAGVFVTTLWQSGLALITIMVLLTKKFPNPLFVNTSPDRELRVSKISGGAKREVNEAGRGNTDREPVAGERSSAGQPETTLMRHERPKRFVYGKKI